MYNIFFNFHNQKKEEEELFVGRTWKDALGEMPPFGETAQERKKWFKFQKQKWQFQRKQRQILRKTGKVNRKTAVESGPQDGTLGAIRKRAKTVLDQFWSIIQGMGFTALKIPKNSRLYYIYTRIHVYIFREEKALQSS